MDDLIDRQRRGASAMLRSAPHEPAATRAEVLGVACSVCSAEPGAECDAAFPHPAFAAGMVFGAGMRGVHLRRYLDKTGDPR